jgi:hypothetical protein
MRSASAFPAQSSNSRRCDFGNGPLSQPWTLSRPIRRTIRSLCDGPTSPSERDYSGSAQFPAQSLAGLCPKPCKLLKFGGRGRDRTCDQSIKSRMLYQLSYASGPVFLVWLQGRTVFLSASGMCRNTPQHECKCTTRGRSLFGSQVRHLWIPADVNSSGREVQRAWIAAGVNSSGRQA